eukprot:CAMPEP_0178409610 /NCGR_PEP_ID=MMETSP0689_2-20121128/20551_1 /TAXON_ID=160604 /ORGANISM="Amphidinium massartii, Strain CS-259" /LENGTH=69 /DNA_ID=CAMNT_0020030757 /DNA_START=381 /DNA_END=590 /DNA_ORIENTATION=-
MQLALVSAAQRSLVPAAAIPASASEGALASSSIKIGAEFPAANKLLEPIPDPLITAEPMDKAAALLGGA